MRPPEAETRRAVRPRPRHAQAPEGYLDELGKDWPEHGAAENGGPDVRAPGRRGWRVDAFSRDLAEGVTWKALMTALDAVIPGFGAGSAGTRLGDGLRSIADAGAVAPLLWRDDAGLAVDLSSCFARRPTVPDATAARSRAAWPYEGALVVDTLDPRRYHRAVARPRSPRDHAMDAPPARLGAGKPGQGEDEETAGIVLIVDLTAAGLRVMNSRLLWRLACELVTVTLYDPASPDSGERTRGILRAVRQVVFVDPALGLGLCLQVDDARTARCLLAFTIDETPADGPALRFVSP